MSSCFPPTLPSHPDIQLDHLNLLKQFEHLDPQNQHTFEARDLELLIQTVTYRGPEGRGLPPGEEGDGAQD